MLRFSNPKLLLYIAMADACAAAVEYISFPEHDEIYRQTLEFRGYVKHPRHNMEVTQYTDDTEMSLANARVLIGQEPPYTRLMFANAYVEEFERGGRRNGY